MRLPVASILCKTLFVLLFLSPIVANAAYTVSTLPGQSFPTLELAETAMRGKDVISQYLVPNPGGTRTYGNGTVKYTYVVNDAPLEEGDWKYWAPNTLVSPVEPGACHDTAGPVIAKLDEVLFGDRSRLCREPIFTPTTWGPPGQLFSRDSCGMSTTYAGRHFTWESEGNNYDINYGVWNNALPPECVVDTWNYNRIYRVRALICPEGYTSILYGRCTSKATATITGALDQTCNQSRGNPCDVATGNKTQFETDSTGSPLTLKRAYHSTQQVAANSSLGAGWYHTFARHLIVPYAGAVNAAVRGNGFVDPVRSRPYTVQNYIPYTGSGFQINPNGSGWKLSTTTGVEEYYDADGRLTMLHRNGREHIYLTYNGPDGKLSRVSDSQGNSLDFNYHPNGLLAAITDQANKSVQYSYDGIGNLLTVTYPDATSRHYHYEDSRFRHHLTGITDETGNRYATWAYDNEARAVLSTHANSADRVTLQFTDATSTTVTGPLGSQEVFNFKTVNGLTRVASITEEGASTTFDYRYGGWTNPQVRLYSETDKNGNQTTYTWNTHNLKSVTTATGTPDARTVSYTYDATHPTKIASIAEPNRTTAFAYDGDGNLISRTVTDTQTGTSRSWTFAYLPNINHMQSGDPITPVLLTSINGPRGDVSDITTLTYNAQSHLASVTNALGHQWQITAHDPYGRPATVVDPNGLVIQLGYDLRGRLATYTRGSELIDIDYDGVGNVTRLTLPDGRFVSYQYDAAHRLTRVEDQHGNRLQLTVDLDGNVTQQEARDSTGALQQIRSYVYNSLGRLIKTLGAANQTNTLGYDAKGNATQSIDAENNTTASAYDALDRLISSTDANQGVAQYAYDTANNLTSVQDPNDNTTAYTYNGFGEVTQLNSPDTGTTTFTYDTAGNVLSKTDAKGQSTTYTYDALNRVTQITYADNRTVVFSYDQGANAIGRLSRVQDISGTTDYSYDQHGRRVSKVSTTHGVSLTTTYTYNSVGQQVGMTTPAGNQLTYSYSNGELSGITLNNQTLLSALSYQPFGPVNGGNWGNGLGWQRSFDSDGQLTQHSLGNSTRTLTYDLRGNVDAINDAAVNQTFGYDPLSRLNAATGTNLDQAFAYDANGNRTQLTEAGIQSTYTYAANSNRLMSIAGGTTRSYQYDANGNITSDGSHSYTYDATNRLIGVDGTVGYVLNEFGQRVLKDAANDDTWFAYDENGQLIGEYDSSGAAKAEYVYLDGMPVAVVQQGNVYYIHVDHLGTPRVVVRPGDNTVIWRWDSDPFGRAAANDDPDGDGTAFTLNLRFPGQYYDAETGLHYNYFRDYDPGTGRYVQSDPIGLAGGLNTYGYVGGNPVNRIDPSGLVEFFTYELNSQQSSTLNCECGQSFSAFSGASGAPRNNPDFANAVGRGPLPPGTYYIVDRPTGGRLGWFYGLFRGDWYALYRADGNIDDFTTIGDLTRGNFRLHPGGRSEGCLTLSNQEQFDQLRRLLENTEPGFIPSAGIPYYGVVDVLRPGASGGSGIPAPGIP